jgi:hypothetical protein
MRKNQARYNPELQVKTRERLNFLCYKLGVKLTVLADKSQIKYDLLFAFLTNRRNLSQEKLERLLKALKEYVFIR